MSRRPENEWERDWLEAYQQELKDGGGNPLVENFRYAVFTSRKGRKTPRTIELLGRRDSGRHHQIKDDSFPTELEVFAESVLGWRDIDYNQLLEQLRKEGKP